MDFSRYAYFDVYPVTYSKVYNHEIKAYILFPKALHWLPGKKHPVIVKIHGGGFVSGSAIFPDWFTPYILSLALIHNAIIVSPNYRLLPESSMLDILTDSDTFWSWYRNGGFQASLPPTVQPDLDRTLLYGDSAGGYVAIQSALRQPTDFVRAIIAAYPMIDLEDPYYNPKIGVPHLPIALLDNHLKAMNPDPTKRELVSDDLNPLCRLQLGLSIIRQGRLRDFCGENEFIFPFKVIKERKEKLPFLWLYHGDRDDAVVVSDSVKFAKEMENRFGKESVMLHVEPGAGHGFDSVVTLETGWLKKGLVTVLELWLK